MTVPKLKIASTVTAEHGVEFAADWIEVAIGTLETYEAFTRIGLVEWPPARTAQLRYHAIEDEIFELTFPIAGGQGRDRPRVRESRYCRA